jgi:uncharacterized protein (TIGR02611 family)
VTGTDETEPSGGDASRAARWAQRLAERKERHQRRSRVYRVGWVIAGCLVTLAGVAMLVTPGPAFVVIPIGLSMLALEFAWAEAALEKALLQAEKAQEKAKQADTRQKVFTVLAGLLAVAAVVAGIFYWDINLPVINPN